MDDIITMLTRVTIREQTTHAVDGICVVPWFESQLMEYLHYCGYQESEKEDQERNENSEHDDSTEDENEEEDVRKGRMHAIGERLSSAIDLNDPGRILKLKEWEEKKMEEAKEKENKKAARDEKRKEREMIAKTKEKQRNASLKEQEEMVAFLVSVGGFLPGDFDGKKSLVPKSVLLKLISTQKLGGQAWKKWLAAKGKAPIAVNSKDATMELLWTYVNDIRSTEPTRL